MPFEPGNNANPDGAKRPMAFLGALNRALAQGDGKKLRQAAEQLLTQAANGEPWAIKELADRLDGKAGQSVAVTGADGGDLFKSLVAAAEAMRSKVRG